MLSSKLKKEAMVIHKNAVDKYDKTFKVFSSSAEKLYFARSESAKIVTDIEILINSIANTPKDLGAVLAKVGLERDKFRATESYAQEAYESSVKSGVSLAAGLATGATVAAVSPSVAMWVATTYGVASTGTAISTLHGAVATKAALAWLGGGALAAGGGGTAAGTALLALAGPVGWGIAGLSSVTSVTMSGLKNSKIAKQMMEEAENITIAGAKVKESGAVVDNLLNQTNVLAELLKEKFGTLKALENANYADISHEEQLELGTLVNNSFSLAELLNKIVE